MMGKKGKVDLKDIIHKYKQAEPLKSPQAFSQFYLDSWPTFAWDCGFDVAPETLYEKCESGSRGTLTPSPHTTPHAGPHGAVHEDYRAVAG